LAKDVRLTLEQLIDQICPGEPISLDELPVKNTGEKHTIAEDTPLESTNGMSSYLNETANNEFLNIDTNISNNNLQVIVKDVLDSIIWSICEKTELQSDDDRSKSDVVIIEDLLSGLVKQVSNEVEQQSSSHDQGEKFKQKQMIKRSFASACERDRFKRIADRCLDGFGFCLRRFHEHYKSQYGMAHFLAYNSEYKVLFIYNLIFNISYMRFWQDKILIILYKDFVIINKIAQRETGTVLFCTLSVKYSPV